MTLVDRPARHGFSLIRLTTDDEGGDADDHRRAQLRALNADMRAIKSPWLYRATENPQLYWAGLLTALTIVAIFTVLFFLRHTPHEFYYPAVPAAADGVDPLSYSDDMTSWCGEQSIEGLADRFGVAPTREAAAWAVANEARDLRDGLWWNAGYDGCLRGLRSPQ